MVSPVALIKKCRHGRGLTGDTRLSAWKRCGCKWLADLTIDGRRKLIDLGTGFPAARRRHTELVAARSLGEPINEVPSDVCRIEAVADRWMRQKEPTLAVNTVRSYRDGVRVLLDALAGADVRDITPVVIADMESALLRGGFASGTVANVRGILSGVLGRAVAEGLISEHPRSAAPIARKQDEPMVLAPDAMRRVLDVVDSEWRAITMFTWLTGLRAGEALALDDSRWRGSVVTVDRQIVQRTGKLGPPKGGRVRDVDVSPAAIALIPVGVDGRWWRCGYTAWLRRWHDALALTGVDQCGLHVLRHSNVALRFAAGQTPAYVARQLGHSSAAFTLRRYGRWIPSLRDDPAGLDAEVMRHGFPVS